MFSGKTRKLVTSLEKYILARRNVMWFEPTQDTRGGSHGSHISQRMQDLKQSEYAHCFTISKPEEIISISEEMLDRFRIASIYIDEYHMLDFKRQFFYDYNNSKLSKVPLVFSGLIVGCDAIVLDVAREVIPFMDEIIKENAVCMTCGEPANYYNYIGEWKAENIIDTGKNYECLCHDCYMKATKKPIICE